jgi:hypothetical protein
VARRAVVLRWLSPSRAQLMRIDPFDSPGAFELRVERATVEGLVPNPSLGTALGEQFNLSGNEERAQRLTTSSLQWLGGDRGQCSACAYSCLTISTEISTAGVVPLFSSQCVVFLSSGQPTPGPYSVATPLRWSVIVPSSM